MLHARAAAASASQELLDHRRDPLDPERVLRRPTGAARRRRRAPGPSPPRSEMSWMSTNAMPRLPASALEDRVVPPDAGRLDARVAVRGALRRDRVVRRRDGDDSRSPAAWRGGRRGSRSHSPRTSAPGTPWTTSLTPTRIEAKSGASDAQPRQLGVDHVARREAVHAEIRDELESRRPVGRPAALDELVRPPLGRPRQRGPDRVRVAERDVAERRSAVRHGCEARKSRASTAKSTGRSSEGTWATSGQISRRAPATSASMRAAASNVAG